MANKAYIVTVRRLANGCDYSMRIFAIDAFEAGKRAVERARISDRFSGLFISEAAKLGVAFYRVVSCEIAKNQSRSF
jgi:hypothetical protein